MKKPKIPKLYGRKPFSKAAYGKDWNTVKKKVTGSCHDCGTTQSLQRHHIIPLSKGGTNHAFNLLILCTGCHAKRHKHLRRRT